MPLVGAAAGDTPYEAFRGQAMGTSYTVKVANRPHNHSLREIEILVAQELERIEQIFSLYRADSELSRLNGAPPNQWIPVSHDLSEVSAHALRLAEQTGGALDPTVGPLVRLWRIQDLAADWQPPLPAEIAEAKRSVGWRLVELRREESAIRKRAAGVEINLNSLVEGWALDRLADLLESRGMHSFLIELGGEFKVAGQRGDGRVWQIGLEDPHEPGSIYATVKVANAAVATSGDYRQARVHAGKRYSHVMDPRTGAPIEHGLSAVSVLANDAIVADGWATALLVLGPVEGRKMAEQQALAASFIRDLRQGSTIELSPAATANFVVAASAPPHSQRIVVIVNGLTLSLLAVLFAGWKYRKLRRATSGDLPADSAARIHAGS